ncbi:glutaredoxin family protein [Aneurinibacillus sp. REN35]|uniref:glutaredoxin family protein n=1 Tax=Aneurinibacillus sp. REN35 TaxID=3237286 RepID=UPI003527F98E
MNLHQQPFRIIIYTREGCGLCNKAKEKVERVARDYPIELTMKDIAQDPELEEAYGQLIPVVYIDEEKVFVSKMTELWLRRELEIRSME